MKFQVLFVFAALLCSTLGGHLPADFKICKHSELTPPNDCLKNAIQYALSKMAQGIAELKTAPLQPLEIPSATIGEGTGAVHIVQNYKNFKIHGLLDSTVDKAEVTVTPKGFTFAVDVHSPEYRFEADYTFSGQLLLLPVVGDGPCNITGKNAKLEIVITGDIIEKKGKEYLHATNGTVKIIPEKVYYRFDNLFNGDELLGTQINNVLNDNWKEIFDDVKDGYEGLLATVFVNYLNSVYSKVPLSELFPK